MSKGCMIWPGFYAILTVTGKEIVILQSINSKENRIADKHVALFHKGQKIKQAHVCCMARE